MKIFVNLYKTNYTVLKYFWCRWSYCVVFLEANEKGLRGLQQLPASLLEVYISEVSIQKGTVQPFDKDGCPPSTTGGPSLIKYYAVVKYIIHNSGDDFSPASAYKGEADCHKPAIFNFLYLEGLIPSVKLSKYATCVVDDELVDGAEGTCASSSSSGMTIRTAKSYGSIKAVSVKFTIEDGDFATLFNAAASTQLALKLSVNSLISPSVPGEVYVPKGSELGSGDWLNPAVFPAPVVLFSAQTQSWSLKNDFSFTANPNRQWAYGYGVGSSFVISSYVSTFGSADYSTNYWFDSAGSPSVGKCTQSYATYGIDPGEVTLESDWGVPTVRWTAPFTATFTVLVQFGGTTAFQGVGFGNVNANLAGVQVNNVEQLYVSFIDNVKTFSFTVTLNGGGIIDAYVGQHYIGGNTMTKFTIDAIAPSSSP